MNAVLWATDSDENAILSLVLQRAGLAVRHARKAEEMVQSWQERPADFAVLAPKEEPVVRAVNQLRLLTHAPIVVVTGLAAEEDVIQLYEAGADLVVERPYSTRKLIAQVKALLRRASGMRLLSLPVLTLHGVTLDPSNRVVRFENQPPVRLTQLEYRLLYTLMANPGQVISTDMLVEQVWGYSGQGDRDLVRGLVKRLRIKIERDPHLPQLILNEPGVGYRFAENPPGKTG